MLRRRVLCSLAVLLLASSRGMAAAPAPETMDEAAIVSPEAGGPLRRVDSRRFKDAGGREFEAITWSDAYGRRRVTVEPAGRAPAGGPQEMDGAASSDGAGVRDATRVSDGAGVSDATSAIDAHADAAAAPAATSKWISIGPDGGKVLAIAASPIDPQLLLAGAANDVGGGPQHSVYRSTDGGASWSASLTVEAQGYGREGRQIAFASDGIAYAAVSHGLYRSRDGGVSWDRLLYGPVIAVAVDPANSQHLWVGLYQYASPRVMRSNDGGATWIPVNVAATPQIDCRTISFDPARPGVVFLGFGLYDKGQVWFSPDDGATWINRTLGLPGTAVNKLVRRGQRLFAALGEWVTGATNGGVYESTDDGLHWLNRTAWSISLSTIAEDVALDPSDSCAIWVANPGGVLRTTNCGSTWAIRVPRGNRAHAVVVTPGAAFAGSENDGVLRSTGGAPFVLSNRGIRELNVTAVAVNPLNPNELAVSVSLQNSGGVHTSLDGGQSWKLEPNLGARMTAVQFAPDGLLYAISDGPTNIASEGLYRRNANGTWTGLGPNPTNFYDSSLASMLFDPAQPGLIVVGGIDYTAFPSRTGIWRSTNAGASWQKTFDAPSGTVPAFALTGTQGARAMLAGVYHYADVTPRGYLLRSTDQGATWTDLRPVGAPTYFYPYSLAVSRQNPDRVFVSSFFGSPAVMRSDDAGQTWATTGAATNFRKLVVHPDDDHVLYGLSEDGASRPVARSRDGGQTFQSFNDGIAFRGWGNGLAIAEGDCPTLLLGNGGGAHVRVADAERPHLSVRTDPNELWPPNHQMIEVHAQVVASDECDPSPRWRLVSIDGGDAGDVSGAAFGEADLTFSLRAARAGSGGGRTYAITYEAEDESGNTERRTTFVVAPHDQSRRRADGADVTELSGTDAVSAPRVVVAGSGLEVRFGLRRADRVRVEVFDLLGARVRTLWDGGVAAGEQVLRWDGRGEGGRASGSGVYLVRVSGGDLEWKGKAVLVR